MLYRIFRKLYSTGLILLLNCCLRTSCHADNNPDYADSYISNIVDISICNNYKNEQPLTLQQAINLTVACNRNVQGHLLQRITDNSALQVTKYKFKPNLNISMRSYYEKTDNNIMSEVNRTTNVIPQFKILTPLGTVINLDWENYISNPNNINTFRNASRIIIRQPLLKESGLDYQTANIKNAEDNNKFNINRLYDLIANEVNNTILKFHQVMQSEKQLDIQHKTLAISQKLYEQTSALIKAGRLAEYELEQVNSQVSSQELNLADAKINLRRAYLTLANQLGIQNINIINSEAKNLTSIPKQTITHEFQQVLSNNINYQHLILQQRIAERDYYVAYDQSRWTLDVIASYQLEGNDNTYTKALQNYFSFSDQKKFLGVEFNIPFDLNPARQQALIENKIKQKQLLLDKKQLEQEIYADYQDKIYEQQMLWDKLQLSQKSIDIKQKNFEMARKKYDVGRLSSFELVRLQDDVNNARVIMNSSLIAYLNNSLLIDKMFNKTFSKWGIDLVIE